MRIGYTEFGYRIGYHCIRSLMHIPRVNISLIQIIDFVFCFETLSLISMGQNFSHDEVILEFLASYHFTI